MAQRDAEGIDPLHGAGADVEDEFVTVAQLDQKARGRLYQDNFKDNGARLREQWRILESE